MCCSSFSWLCLCRAEVSDQESGPCQAWTYPPQPLLWALDQSLLPSSHCWECTNTGQRQRKFKCLHPRQDAQPSVPMLVTITSHFELMEELWHTVNHKPKGTTKHWCISPMRSVISFFFFFLWYRGVYFIDSCSSERATQWCLCWDKNPWHAGDLCSSALCIIDKQQCHSASPQPNKEPLQQQPRGCSLE